MGQAKRSYGSNRVQRQLLARLHLTGLNLIYWQQQVMVPDLPHLPMYTSQPLKTYPCPINHDVGHLVSGFVKQHLPIMLINQLTASEGADVKQALSNTFLEVDASLSSSRIDCEFSGSTAVVSLLKVRTRVCLHLVWACVSNNRSWAAYFAHAVCSAA